MKPLLVRPFALTLFVAFTLLVVGCQPSSPPVSSTGTAVVTVIASQTFTATLTPSPTSTATPKGPGRFVGSFGAGYFSDTFHSPDGKRIFVLINGKEVRWYAASSLQQQGSVFLDLDYDIDYIEVIFGLNENIVAIKSLATIWLIGVKEQKVLETIELHGDYFMQTEFFRDFKSMLYVKLHPTSGGGVAWLSSWGVYSKNVEIAELACRASNFARSPDGELIAFGCNEQIQIWDKVSTVPSRVLLGHPANIKNVAFSADDNLLVSADEEGNIYVWDRKTFKHIHSFSVAGFIIKIAFINNDQQIQVSIEDHLPQMIDLKTRQIQEAPAKEKEVDPLERALYHLGYSKRSIPLNIAISPNQKILAVASESILLWDIESKELIGVLENKSGYLLGKIYFDPTGQFLAGAISRHETLLWDITQNVKQQAPQILSSTIAGCTIYECGEILHHEDGCYFNCPTIAFSPDGRLVAFTDLRTTVELWDTHTATKFATFPVNQDKESWITAIQFSKDGQFVYVSSLTPAPLRKIQVWSVSIKQMIHQIEASTERAYQNIDVFSWPWLAFSSQVEAYQGIGLWNIETQLLRKFNIGNNASVQGFDQSGSLLVIDSLCSTPYILRVATGDFLYQFSEAPFQNFSQLANSNFVMSVGKGAIDLWNIEDILNTLQKPEITPIPSPTHLPCFPG